MKHTKEEFSISHTIAGMNYTTRENLSNATFNRPISAMTKRLDLSSAKTRKTNTSKTNFADLPNLTSTSKNNLLFDNLLNQSSKIVNPSKAMEKERLYEETLHLKGVINMLKHDLSLARGENLKKEKEINKKDKVLEDIVQDSQSMSNIMNLPQDLKAKAKDVNLLVKMKKQFKDLKLRFNQKNEDLENLKKNMKNTKTNELQLEVHVLNEELNKLKALYAHALNQIEYNEKNVKELAQIKEHFSKQHYIVLSLKDEIEKLNKEINYREEFIAKGRETEVKYKRTIEKLKKDLNLAQKRFEFSEKTKNENNDIVKLRGDYESQIEEIKTEMKYHKDIADKKDRRVRELETEMKNLKNNATGAFHSAFNYNDLKFIQDNPDDKLDNVTHLFKSKLIESLQEKEKLEEKIKAYEEKLKSGEYGGFLTSGSKINTLTEEELNDYTYILLKNFEAKKISKDMAMKKLFKDILSKYSLKDADNNSPILSGIIEKVILVLKANDNDSKKIQFFIESLFIMANENMTIFMEKFMEFFDSVKTYTKEEASHSSEIIRNYLTKHVDYLRSSIKLYDTSNTGFISFINFRKTLENMKLRLEDQYIEYLIYVMKSFDDNKIALDELKFENLFELLSGETKNNLKSDLGGITKESKFDLTEALNTEDKTKKSTNNPFFHSEEDSEIVLTTDQFNDKIKRVIRSISIHINKNNTHVKELFQNYIIKPETIDPSLKDYKDDALYLKDFINALKKVNIDLDTIDIYCLYTKFKFIDDFEAINLNQLEQDVNSYPYNPLDVDIGYDSSNITNLNVDKIVQIDEEDDLSNYGFETLENEDKENI